VTLGEDVKPRPGTLPDGLVPLCGFPLIPVH